MCNPNIENNILNWLNSEIKRYEKILKCRGGGGYLLTYIYNWDTTELATI